MCMQGCVRESERERERESVCVCIHVHHLGLVGGHDLVLQALEEHQWGREALQVLDGSPGDTTGARAESSRRRRDGSGSERGGGWGAAVGEESGARACASSIKI